MKKVFIDGAAGTTGLRLNERLAERDDIELIKLPESLRKDISAREEALNSCDIAFLCLPDAAAVEAVSLIKNPNTAVIDTSTAHRCDDNWMYGFPEIGGRRDKIAFSKRIANPGCHASGFIALVAPLTELGILKKDALISCVSLTGYSGGGKKMIEQYESPCRENLLDAPRAYGLGQTHKHLTEMVRVCELENAPAFIPVVAPYYAGMLVTVPLFADWLAKPFTAAELTRVYAGYYESGVINVCENADENGFLSASALAGRDDMQITVFGTGERLVAAARFDNLGKGASGAAVQNMNLLLGADEKKGLVL